MMRKALLFIILVQGSCLQNGTKAAADLTVQSTAKLTSVSGQNIKDRFATPKKCLRTNEDGIGEYLRNLPLKPSGSAVKYFNLALKTKPNVYCAVVDKPIGNKDLDQCADAVMYLWASYLFDTKQYDKIQFKFLNDNKWHKYMTYAGAGKEDEKVFFKYIQEVWQAANTRSLSTQVRPIHIDEVAIGDILLQTGNPYGHAIMVVDACENPATKKKYIMLAQSYMPAQETQVLINSNDTEQSPWYSIEEIKSSGLINTPEWEFTIDDFKRF